MRFLVDVFLLGWYRRSIMIDISTLTPEEKRNLADQLAYELRDRAPTLTPGEAALWEALTMVMPRGTLPPQEAALKRYGRAKYTHAANSFAEVLAEALPDDKRRATRIAMRCLLLTCLVDYMKVRRFRSGLNPLLEAFPLLREAVDAQYPGYLDAGLLKHALKLRQAA